MQPNSKAGPTTMWDINNSFASLKNELMKVDPVYFVEKYLKLEGSPFRITNNGWKWMADIYRFIITSVKNPNAKPIVMVKGRQVGCTVGMTALELYMMSSGMFGINGVPPIRVMHAFPQLELMHSFSKDKLEKMINDSTLVPDYNDKKEPGKLKSYVNSQKDSKREATDSLTYKLFKNGNTLMCESIGSEGTRALGKTFDILLADEVQDMTELAISKTIQCLKHAKFGCKPGGVQVYFGTPRQKGTFFHKIWENSDQRRYYLGCESCENFFLLYTPGSDRWEKDIWIHDNIVKCPTCDHEQDKVAAIERGKWVATPGREDSPFVGFHFNQFLIPDFTKEIILREKPDKNPMNSEITWNTEVIGEFYSGQGMPITFEEIYDKCRDPDRRVTKFITPGEKVSYLGIDWGGKPDVDNIKRGKSFSCGVILTVDHDERFVIEYAEKLTDVSLDGKLDYVEKMFRLFSVKSAMGDIGFAEDLSGELKKIYDTKYRTVRNSGMVTGGIKYNEEELEVVVDRDKIIAEVFNLLRKGAFRFPWASYESIVWLVKHCCSMESKVTERRGEPHTTYIKGRTQNDGLMALINAYLAYKFDKTMGFKNNGHKVGKSSIPRPVLAYIPKLL